jgi:hypothetical protein
LTPRARHIRLLLAALGLLAAVGAGHDVLARGDAAPARPSAGMQTLAAPSGRFAVALRLERFTAEVESFPHAGTEQFGESIELRRGADVLVRIDAFANPRREDVNAWLAGAMKPLGDAATRRLPSGTLPRDSTGALLQFDRSPQTYALRVTCEDRADQDTGTLFARVRAPSACVNSAST